MSFARYDVLHCISEYETCIEALGLELQNLIYYYIRALGAYIEFKIGTKVSIAHHLMAPTDWSSVRRNRQVVAHHLNLDTPTATQPFCLAPYRVDKCIRVMHSGGPGRRGNDDGSCRQFFSGLRGYHFPCNLSFPLHLRQVARRRRPMGCPAVLQLIHSLAGQRQKVCHHTFLFTVDLT